MRAFSEQNWLASREKKFNIWPRLILYIGAQLEDLGLRARTQGHGVRKYESEFLHVLSDTVNEKKYPSPAHIE